MNLLKTPACAMTALNDQPGAGSARGCQRSLKGESVVQYTDQVKSTSRQPAGIRSGRGNDVLMTLFFSNPSMLEQLPGQGQDRPDRSRIAKCQRCGNPCWLDIRITIHDDLPICTKNRAPKAVFYGSQTMKHLLGPGNRALPGRSH